MLKSSRLNVDAAWLLPFLSKKRRQRLHRHVSYRNTWHWLNGSRESHFLMKAIRWHFYTPSRHPPDIQLSTSADKMYHTELMCIDWEPLQSCTSISDGSLSGNIAISNWRFQLSIPIATSHHILCQLSVAANERDFLLHLIPSGFPYHTAGRARALLRSMA